jgi:hypothetical protein
MHFLHGHRTKIGDRTDIFIRPVAKPQRNDVGALYFGPEGLHFRRTFAMHPELRQVAGADKLR